MTIGQAIQAAHPAPSVHFKPPATLEAFMASQARYRVVVGPVGSGKTTACLMELVRRAREQKPGPDGKRRTRFAVVRSTYRELRDTTRKTFEQWFGHEFGSWREGDFAFHMRFGDVHSEFMFRSLDQPEDIRKLLSLELTGSYVNEFRELSREAFDHLSGRIGRYPRMAHGGPTWKGIIGDTNPWHSRHWANAVFKSGPAFRLFRQPGGRSPQAENLENLDPHYYTDLVAGKDAEWTAVYIDGEDAVGVVGSIYGKLIDALEKRGGLQPFDHPKERVVTVWDLGRSDATSIFFFRVNEETRNIDLIDWYEAQNEPLSHYFEVLDTRGYQYAQHHLPHDARAKTLASSLSIVEQFVQRYGDDLVSIAPALSVEDGIAAARWLLEQPIRIHPRCGTGIDHLRAYRYEWDDANRTYGRRPVHDFSSHAADAFRYLALVAKHTEFMTRPPPEADPRKAREIKIGVSLSDFTLEQLFQMHERDVRERDY
jgi:Phage terminase large subunit